MTIYSVLENIQNKKKILERDVEVYFHRKHMSRDMTKPTKLQCAQRRLRSAWAAARSDQSLRYALNGWLRSQAFFMRTAKTLIRLGGFPG